MTATLRQQRDETQREQLASVQRSRQLDDALERAEAAAAEREALAKTVPS